METLTSTWVYDDGGRAALGLAGGAGDCVARAITIASELPYEQVYRTLANRSKDAGGKKSARDGVSPKVYKPYLAVLGWRWVPTMSVGSGCQVHLRSDELPSGRIIVRCSRHLVAVVDGVIHDTHDPSRSGTRCVYGYWARD